MVTTIITVMAAYSNERVAAIILSVLYRMLTLVGCLLEKKIFILLYTNKIIDFLLILCRNHL